MPATPKIDSHIVAKIRQSKLDVVFFGFLGEEFTLADYFILTIFFRDVRTIVKAFSKFSTSFVYGRQSVSTMHSSPSILCVC